MKIFYRRNRPFVAPFKYIKPQKQYTRRLCAVMQGWPRDMNALTTDIASLRQFLSVAYWINYGLSGNTAQYIFDVAGKILSRLITMSRKFLTLSSSNSLLQKRVARSIVSRNSFHFIIEIAIFKMFVPWLSPKISRSGKALVQANCNLRNSIWNSINHDRA